MCASLAPKGLALTIAAWPIGTTQTRIGEAGEGTKQNQIEGEEQREQGEYCRTRCGTSAWHMLEPNPGKAVHTKASSARPARTRLAIAGCADRLNKSTSFMVIIVLALVP